MGQYISMLFGYDEVEYTELPQDTSTKLTKDVFKDLSKYPKLIKKFASIKKNQLIVPIKDMDEFIDDLVDFTEQYLDLGKMGGKHSKLWKGYVHHDELKKRLVAIRSKVIEILNIDESTEKADKTLGYYLKKFITHFFGDECGGFTLTDTRETKDELAIKYMHTHKLENMRGFVKNVLKLPGFVFCTEYDWENCLDGTCENISFHQFNTNIHKDNSAKALFYTSDMTMREYSETEIKAMMTENQQTKYMGDYEKYQDKFTVFTIYNPTAKEGELFHDEVIVIGIHATSIGTKSAIVDNLDEYRFLKSVIQSYSDFNSIIIGDFNLPEYSEGLDYFGIGTEERVIYPIQNSFYSEFEDHSTFMTQGYERYSLYDPKEDVASKERTGRADKNSQSVLGKCFLRHYNTDGAYGKFNIKVKTDSSLFPPNTKEANLMIPLITGNTNSDWLSDHQAPVMKLTDSKENSYNISAYNVLSQCCSGGQPFKEELTTYDIDVAGDEFCDILSELANIMMENISA